MLGRGLLAELGRLLAARRRATQAVIVTDRNVQPHAEAAADALAGSQIDCDIVLLEPGEQEKSPPRLVELWEALLELGADRRTLVVAVGGGVIGDLAGFAAATYARGLPLVQAPTSLLAQVDSSVGGKVAVNLSTAKNQAGAFWQPTLVVADLDTLATLPPREHRAGLAEVAKYGLALDADFCAFLESSAAALLRVDSPELQRAIARSCRLKADVVERDEREESGLRAALNYGHTFAHAVETVSGYGAHLHGEAVAMGMQCAARLARALGRIDESFVARQTALLAALELPTELPGELAADDLLAAMRHDKKVAHGRLRFVLPTRLGHVELVDDVPEREVLRAIKSAGRGAA